MAPIYNPAASATATGADEQYFTDLGLLTGLTKLIDISGGDTFPTPTAGKGTAAAVSGNSLKWGAAIADSWQGYNLSGGPFTKLLTIVYISQSSAPYQYLFNNKAVLNVTTNYPDDTYAAVNSPGTPDSSLYKITSTTWTALGIDATWYSGTTATPVPSDPPYGMALYTSYTGGAGSQRMFMRMGTAEWVPLFTTTDGDTQEFQSVQLWTRASNQRAITPFTVWGA